MTPRKLGTGESIQLVVTIKDGINAWISGNRPRAIRHIAWAAGKVADMCGASQQTQQRLIQAVVRLLKKLGGNDSHSGSGGGSTTPT